MSKDRSKILIVDDATTNIKVLRTILADDYEIYFTRESVKVKEIAKARDIDLILLDIVMPDMDGYQVCADLKSDFETVNIPVIFVTGKSNTEDEEKGLKAGAIDYITKPFSAPIVKARVKNQIKLKAYHDQLADISLRDGLTGLYNKRKLNEVLIKEWGRAFREGSSISIVIIDIDYFKKYNDTYGHLKGDSCLCDVATAISDSIHRPTDVVVRFGGEEFLCVFSGTDVAGAEAVAQKIRKNVSALKIPHKSSDVSKFVTVSLGVCGVKQVTELHPTEIIMEKADEMLYQAKESGRNKICTVSI
ncbi:MAG: diguanylate cyclase [Leptospirales bacterium]